MTWEPALLIIEMRQGKLQHARIVLRGEAGAEAVLHLGPKAPPRLEGAEPSLPLALAAAGYATGVASRREAPRPGGVRLFVDGREQRVLTRYGDVLTHVAELTDAYADTL